MCTYLAARSMAAWLEIQERIMREWAAEVALDPDADLARLATIEDYCRWLAEERGRIDAAAPVSGGGGLSRKTG